MPLVCILCSRALTDADVVACATSALRVVLEDTVAPPVSSGCLSNDVPYSESPEPPALFEGPAASVPVLLGSHFSDRVVLLGCAEAGQSQSDSNSAASGGPLTGWALHLHERLSALLVAHASNPEATDNLLFLSRRIHCFAELCAPNPGENSKSKLTLSVPPRQNNVARGF